MARRAYRWTLRQSGEARWRRDAMKPSALKANALKRGAPRRDFCGPPRREVDWPRLRVEHSAAPPSSAPRLGVEDFADRAQTHRRPAKAQAKTPRRSTESMRLLRIFVWTGPPCLAPPVMPGRLPLYLAHHCVGVLNILRQYRPEAGSIVVVLVGPDARAL